MLLHGSTVSDFDGVSLSGGYPDFKTVLPDSKELESWWLTCPETTPIGQSDTSSSDKHVTLSEIPKLDIKDQGTYINTTVTITQLRLALFFVSISYLLNFCSQDNALYQACSTIKNERMCSKKVIKNTDGTYRYCFCFLKAIFLLKFYSCAKCSTDDTKFAWKILLHLHLSDFTDSIPATCFQVLL